MDKLATIFIEEDMQSSKRKRNILNVSEKYS